MEAWEQTQLSFDYINFVHLAFRDWLSHWIKYFVMEDGARGSTLPKFIGTLLAIWCLQNSQVFRQHQQTTTSISVQL